MVTKMKLKLRDDALSGELKNADVWQHIGGFYYVDETSERKIKLELGYLSLNDLAKLARASAAMHALFQPLLTAANVWRQTETITRALSDRAEKIDYLMMALVIGESIPEDRFTIRYFDYSPSLRLGVYMLCSCSISMFENERQKISTQIEKNYPNPLGGDYFFNLLGEPMEFPVDFNWEKLNMQPLMRLMKLLLPHNVFPWYLNRHEDLTQGLCVLKSIYEGRLSLFVLKYLFTKFQDKDVIKELSERLEGLGEQEMLAAWKKFCGEEG